MLKKLFYLKKSKLFSIMFFIWCMTFASLAFAKPETETIKEIKDSKNKIINAVSKEINTIKDNTKKDIPINNDTKPAPKFPYDKIFQLLGFGGVTGFIIGYTIKKMAKIAVIFLGLIFILLQGLAYKGYITVNWMNIKADLWPEAAQRAALWGKLMQVLKTGFPYASGLGVGLFLGLKKG